MTRQEFDEAYDNGYKHGYAAGTSELDVLDKIRAEIEEHRNKTEYMDKYDLVGDCLDIIDKYRNGDKE